MRPYLAILAAVILALCFPLPAQFETDWVSTGDNDGIGVDVDADFDNEASFTYSNGAAEWDTSQSVHVEGSLKVDDNVNVDTNTFFIDATTDEMSANNADADRTATGTQIVIEREEANIPTRAIGATAFDTTTSGDGGSPTSGLYGAEVASGFSGVNSGTSTWGRAFIGLVSQAFWIPQGTGDIDFSDSIGISVMGDVTYLTSSHSGGTLTPPDGAIGVANEFDEVPTSANFYAGSVFTEGDLLDPILGVVNSLSGAYAQFLDGRFWWQDGNYAWTIDDTSIDATSSLLSAGASQWWWEGDYADGRGEIDESTLNGAEIPGIPGSTANCYGIVTGGNVGYSGTGLVYTVGLTNYRITCASFTVGPADVTLDTGDALDRFDTIYADNTGSLGVEKGTAAVNPQIPTIDVETQIRIADIRVTALSTTPGGGGLAEELVYDENTGATAEWNTTTSGGTITTNATVNPSTNSTHIEWDDSVTGNYIRFEEANFDTTSYDQLMFDIKPEADWSSRSRIQILCRDDGVAVGNIYALEDGVDFDRNQTGSYQTVIIPLSALGIENSTIDYVQMSAGQSGGGSPVVNCYMDNVWFREQDSDPVGPGGNKWTRFVDGDGDFVDADTETDVFTFADTSSVTTDIDLATDTISFTAVAGGIDHGSLSGLTDTGPDDHTQYGVLAEVETISANWVNTAFPWDITTETSGTLDESRIDADIARDSELIADGTSPSTLLRWNGSAWVEELDAILEDDGDLRIDGYLEVDTDLGANEVPGGFGIGTDAGNQLVVASYGDNWSFYDSFNAVERANLNTSGNWQIDGVLDSDGTGTNTMAGHLDVEGNTDLGSNAADSLSVLAELDTQLSWDTDTGPPDTVAEIGYETTGSQLYIAGFDGISFWQTDAGVEVADLNGSGNLQIDGTLDSDGTGSNTFSGFVRTDNGAAGSPTVASGPGDIYAEDAIEADGVLNIAGVASLNGNVNLGDGVASDLISFNGDVASQIKPDTDGGYDFGDSSAHWSTGFFNNLDDNDGTLGVLANLQVTGDIIRVGTEVHEFGAMDLVPNYTDTWDIGNYAEWQETASSGTTFQLSLPMDFLPGTVIEEICLTNSTTNSGGQTNIYGIGRRISNSGAITNWFNTGGDLNNLEQPSATNATVCSSLSLPHTVAAGYAYTLQIGVAFTGSSTIVEVNKATVEVSTEYY